MKTVASERCSGAQVWELSEASEMGGRETRLSAGGGRWGAELLREVQFKLGGASRPGSQQRKK